MRQHFSDPSFYARRYRAAVDAPQLARPPRRPRLGIRPFSASAWWLPHRQSGDDGRPKAPPSALDRWLVRPFVFLPAMLIGLLVVATMINVSYDAPLSQGLLVVAGFITAWFGLAGAAGYIGGRWPWAEPILMVALSLLGIAAFVTGIILTNRVVIGGLLAQAGIWTMIVSTAAWWKNRSGQGEK